MQALQYKLLKDEQYFVAFLSAVLAGSADPTVVGNESAARSLTKSPKLRQRIESARTEYKTVGGEARSLWKPEIERINRVVLKNARGHAYFEYGEPMLTAPAHIWTLPLESTTATERQEFEAVTDAEGLSFWPEVGMCDHSRHGFHCVVQIEDAQGFRVMAVWECEDREPERVRYGRHGWMWRPLRHCPLPATRRTRGA